MVEFKNCVLNMELEAQTPMIHFQSRQVGATLRGSEVKPKFDKYILKILGIKRDAKSQDVSKAVQGYFSDFEKKSLNYKLTIEEKDASAMVSCERYPLLYGQAEGAVNGIYSNPRVQIVCFQPELQKIISENIIPFFLSHNFGMVQGKGFGSFLPKNCGFGNVLKSKEEKIVAAALKKETGAQHCYVIRFEKADNETIESKFNYNRKQFQEIKTFYSVLKSGQNFNGYARSYLFEYMHEEKGIGNEKAWMKQTGIAPSICKPQNEGRVSTNKKDENVRYVRGLLGIASRYEFLTEIGNYRNKKIITIENTDLKDKKIERTNSPIRFKIVKNVVFICTYPIPGELYNRKYQFKSETNSDIISTPAKDEFAIEDFLASYVQYYNNELRSKISNVRKKVGEVGK